MKLFDLSGKTALVTGSSRGLGFAMARGLAEAGASIVLNGRDADRLGSAVRALRDDGYEARTSIFDVTDESAVGAAVAELGPVHILINNAGTMKRALVEDLDPSDLERVHRVHVTGAFITSKAVLSGMKERGSGKIINICSLTSEVGRPGIAAYMAAKGGLRNLTKAMALDWARHNIQVNGIGPGYFKTEITKPLSEDPEFDEWLCKRTPAGRWGEPEELAGAAVFLASAASNFVSGHILYVDGGVLASL